MKRVSSPFMKRVSSRWALKKAGCDLQPGPDRTLQVPVLEPLSPITVGQVQRWLELWFRANANEESEKEAAARAS
jgi:hypothetical protein